MKDNHIIFRSLCLAKLLKLFFIVLTKSTETKSRSYRNARIIKWFKKKDLQNENFIFPQKNMYRGIYFQKIYLELFYDNIANYESNIYDDFPNSIQHWVYKCVGQVRSEFDYKARWYYRYTIYDEIFCKMIYTYDT